ncbi:MAG TPA: hypothetical protein VK788_28255 [Terriglobales bacterium]|jgi:hypothetical protein|nr:hypothetical protein [Terriglobales bacterium]
MLELRSATPEEMVLAFLKAEIDSERFGSSYQATLAQSGFDRCTLIDSPDLHSTRQNAARWKILATVKGGLFQGLADVSWRRVALEKIDIPRLKYLNHRNWIEFSGGTRLVSDGAKNIRSRILPNNTNPQILAIADDVRNGKTYPELIAVAEEGQDIILVEGHMRATAYILAGWSGPIDCILGASPSMHKWDTLLRQ